MKIIIKDQKKGGMQVGKPGHSPSHDNFVGFKLQFDKWQGEKLKIHSEGLECS